MNRRDIRHDLSDMCDFLNDFNLFRHRIGTVRAFFLPASVIQGDMEALEEQARKMIEIIWLKNDGWWLNTLAEGSGNGQTAGRVICAIGDLREVIRVEFPSYYRRHIETED